MSLTSHLPIYKASYDLTINLFQMIKEFTREYKYTLGEQCKQEAIVLICTITKANMARDKKLLLEQARGQIETLRILLRLSKDLHLFSLEKFVTVNTSIESISKQLTGREKSCR
jgi:predicted metal-binding transcription factor (methanogenesis marker protein 9)